MKTWLALGSNTLRGGLAAALMMAGVALSSTAHANEPERTIETYGAWELQCARLADTGGGPGRACEVVQTIQLQGQAQPLTRMAIGRPAPQADLVAVVVLPLGLWLPAGVTFDLGAEAGRYEAELTLTDTILNALRSDPEAESALVFAMQPNDPARVPLVHRGFGAAFDAMERTMSPE